jgi:hypothetical protein
MEGTRPRVLLAATGSVATVKVPEIAVRLAETFEVGNQQDLQTGGGNQPDNDRLLSYFALTGWESLL